jgi:hypothetical protein
MDGGIWLVALVFAWLICHWRGYTLAAWAFNSCAENRRMEGSKCRSYRVTHYRHLIHHTASR